jgi:beta-lactamase regulating signal transducer with metallopeptidase domain
MILNPVQVMEGLSGVAASAFVSGIWQGIVLAAGVALCLRLVPKTTAAVRFLLWSAVFVVLALLPFLRLGAARAAGMMAAPVSLHRPLHVDMRWSFAIAAVWVVLSAIRAGGLAVSAIQLRRIWKRATPVRSGVGGGLYRCGNGRRMAQLCTSVDVDSPSVIGFFSPRVLIPAELFDRLTAMELEQIVLHEIGHLRRADDWINLLQKLGLVLFPLNPALMWIEKRLCFERELACDDGVLHLTKAPKAYATCLTTLAESRLDRRRAALTLGAWERQSELSRRVHRILRWGEGMGRGQARVVFGVLVLAVLGGATELARCPQLVSFSPVLLPQTALAAQPEERALRSTGAYQNVVFHPSNPSNAGHETLLKASMPPAGQAQARQVQARRVVRKPALHRASQSSSQRAGGAVHPTQRWVVLTSWDDSSSTRMVFTVAREQTSYPTYAAVPTAGGWLVIPL